MPSLLSFMKIGTVSVAAASRNLVAFHVYSVPSTNYHSQQILPNMIINEKNSKKPVTTFELENFQFCSYFHGVQHFRGPK